MFNLSKIFGRETPANIETKEELSYSAVVEGKEPFDPQARTFNFTEQEIEKFKSEGKNDLEIELLKKTVLNKLARARFDDVK